MILLFTQCQDNSNKKQAQLDSDKNTLPKVEFKKIHGFSSEVFSIDSSTVKSGESFGELLQKLGASFSDIHTLGENFKSVYDIRRIYPGDKYYSIRVKDSLKLSKFIYQHSPTEIIIMNFQKISLLN